MEFMTPEIIAHRGASYLAPENTLSAFRKAMEIGADGVEMDVQQTSDKKLVIHHDFVIDWHTDMRGQIYDMTEGELKALDFGSWKDVNYRNERIATLQEALALCREMEGTIVQLEMKATIDDDPDFVPRVIEEVRAANITDRLVVISFNHDLLRQAKQLMPELKVGVLVYGALETMALPTSTEKALELYKTAENDGAYTDFDAAGRCELTLLRAACAKPEPFAAVRGVSEGLEHRLEHAVRQSTSLPQLLDALTTVRYPRARMRRLAMDAALGYTADTVPALPPALHLLGARKDALPLLGQVSLPVSHSLAKLAQTGPDGARMAAAQAAASDFGALCRANPAPMGGIYRQKNIFLTN